MSRAKARSGPKENFKAAPKVGPTGYRLPRVWALCLICLETAARYTTAIKPWSPSHQCSDKAVTGLQVEPTATAVVLPHKMTRRRAADKSRSTTSDYSRQAVSGRSDFWGGFANCLRAGSRFSATRELARKCCLTGEFVYKLAGSSFAPARRQFAKRSLRDKRRPSQ